MDKIVTITLNPAIDKSTTVAHLVPEKKLVCAMPRFEPGGGGVNVSRAIKKLEGSSTAIYFSGGYSGKFFEQLLEAEGINSIAVPISGSTRENMIVVDQTSNLQYRFGMPAPSISTAEIDKLFETLVETKHADYLVASGSVPEEIAAYFFENLSAIGKKIEAHLIVDTSGTALQTAINQGTFLIKPNLGELSFLNGVEELGDDDIVPAARSIIKNGGAQVVVVSMGQSGAMLVTKNEVFKASTPTVRKKSTVGAGDTMLAGMVLSMARSIGWEQVLNYGVAAGTATTMNAGTELCKKHDVERLFACISRKSKDYFIE